MSLGLGYGEEDAAARAGRLGCACPEERAGVLRRPPGQWQLAGGFALIVLAQALTLGVLPLAGAMLDDGLLFHGLSMAGLPLAAFFLGAACASLPASFLLDAFGRRAAFALGASLGVAGGLIAAYAVTMRLFPALVVGGFWLGSAQGFGMFYRHAAAFGTGSAGRAGVIARLLGAGALAGIAGPAAAGAVEALFTPFTFVGTLTLAALAQLGALSFAVTLPEARFSHAELTADAEATAPRPETPPWRALLAPTLVGILAWSAMTSAMSSAPLAMADCGISLPVISGLVAWHVVAMYAPALLGGRLALLLGNSGVALCGVALCLGAALYAHVETEAARIGIGFLLVGAGWSLATLGATLMLHARGAPSRFQLAAHDAALLLAALAGTLL
ncbi:MFS transporter [Ancylobacter sp. A5.8]|uniref:MFS transporter n=1 Tax=Ancylobacter gelatini TaxID=2919920 RepID=UPI001F4E9E10|nr:MFS transporter [Ancylobacter gelatini]MCJ8142739.1 MFS transporter [Ancylobacter gelatini]